MTLWKSTCCREVCQPNIQFGVYVGGWYSTYYEVGVNWASNRYNTSLYYKWATAKYKDYGYAELMDQMLICLYFSLTSLWNLRMDHAGLLATSQR